MGADSPAENTPNASKNFSPKCLPKPKSSRFLKKDLSGVRNPWFMAQRRRHLLLDQSGKYQGQFSHCTGVHRVLIFSNCLSKKIMVELILGLSDLFNYYKMFPQAYANPIDIAIRVAFCFLTFFAKFIICFLHANIF